MICQRLHRCQDDAEFPSVLANSMAHAVGLASFFNRSKSPLPVRSVRPEVPAGPKQSSQNE